MPEKRIPNGTFVQEKNGENRELKIVDAIEQNNQFGHGRFLYRFDGLTDVGFGLYHHEFNIIK